MISSNSLHVAVAKLKVFCNSQVAQYMGARYFSFGLQFINFILIARALGTYGFGIYSFLLLVIQYLSYLVLGPSFSLNAILSSKKDDAQYANSLWGSSVLIISVITGITFVAAIGLSLSGADLFSKYDFRHYILYVFLIFALTGFNNVCVNLYRIYAQLREISLNLVLPQIVIFAVLMLHPGDGDMRTFIYWLLAGTILANFVSLVVFMINSPLKFNLACDIHAIHELIFRGIHLLLYNVSFYFMLLASRTIVSIFYSANDLALYSLAVSLSNAIFMIINSLSFLMFPKLINKFYNGDLEQNDQLLDKIRSVYVTGCYLLTYIGFAAIPVIEWVLPDYRSAMPVFRIMLIAQLVINNNLGYSSLLVAKKKEGHMTRFALTSLVVIIVTSMPCIYFSANLLCMSACVFLGFMIYTFLICKGALSECRQNVGYYAVAKELFPLHYFIPFILLVLGVIFGSNIIFPAASLLVFIALNRSRIVQAGNMAVNLVARKNSLNF